MIPFLIDLHGMVAGEKCEALTRLTRTFLDGLKELGATFSEGEAAFNLATVRHAWLCSRVFWEQDPANPSINHQRSESIQVTENLLDGSRQGEYKHLEGR
jgi:hypothetical protein